jgi:tetratricopeptide (TPR) repeat protein
MEERMPRPSKPVPPDTLGGRIRAARENLRFSLAQVAGDRYSTSLISQIERNRVEPSHDSLLYLSEKLRLPFMELEQLARQQREAESEVQQYRRYEEIMEEVNEARAHRDSTRALKLLESLSFAHIPLALRWRLASLRGQCYFDLRRFVLAQKDFLIAVAEKPETVPEEQRLEEMILHLRLAATYRELGQLDEALEEYQIALGMMDSTTSLIYVAETHWGISLIASELANRPRNGAICPVEQARQLRIALEHASNASILYRSVGQKQREALLLCQIGLIKKAQGNLAEAREQLRAVLDKWRNRLEEPAENPAESQRERKEWANLVSVVACSLACIELEEKHYDEALRYIKQAQAAGQMSYRIRQAEAAMTLGRILEAMDKHNPQAQQAFREAINVLAPTDRLAARIRAHDLLGRHLLKIGETEAGERELDYARYLANLASGGHTPTLTPEGEMVE